MSDDHTIPAGDTGPGGDIPRELEDALAESRERLGQVPAELVVGNHAMGLYELAAIHLTAVPPRMTEAALAIDAVACLVDGLGERLGEHHETLATALATIRMAYVDLARQQSGQD